MNTPTRADEGKPVINLTSGRVREIRFRADGRVGVWTMYLGWRGGVNWANWQPLEREPLTGMREWYELAGEKAK